jgi:hypothetical protein
MTLYAPAIHHSPVSCPSCNHPLRCLGKGYISAFGHIHGGVCFRCEGSGKLS